MPVPKASVHEDHTSIFRQHKIRAAWKSGAAQSVAKAARMKRLSHQEFDLCVRSPDPRHLRRPLLRGKDVSQCYAASFARFFRAVELALMKGAMTRATSAITGTTTELPNCL